MIDAQLGIDIHKQKAAALLQKGKEFAASLSGITIDHASRSDFDLGPKLVEIESHSDKSKAFEVEINGESIGGVIITYRDSNRKAFTSIQLVSKDRSKTKLLHEFSTGIQVKRGKYFAYNISSDSISFNKMTHLSDVSSLLHEFGHAFEDRELRKVGLLTLAKKIIKGTLMTSKAADFVYLEAGSNYMKLVNDLDHQLQNIFPNEEKGFIDDLQKPISTEELEVIYQDEENAHIYLLERLLEILEFFGIPPESELGEKILDEQANYAGVCLRTYENEAEDCVGFDPIATVKENNAQVTKFGIEPNDQVTAT